MLAADRQEVDAKWHGIAEDWQNRHVEVNQADSRADEVGAGEAAGPHRWSQKGSLILFIGLLWRWNLVIEEEAVE